MKYTLRKIIVKILRWESQLVIWKYNPKIIAITGSVGKTSTKDAMYAVLSSVAYVRKSEKSYNSEFGLPLTVLGVPNGWTNLWVWTRNAFAGLWLFLWPHKYPEWLILEVGVGKPGDMKKTAGWLSTDAVVMTAIGDLPVHIEFFESRKHLVDEKAGLIKTLKKGGVLVLNADDETIVGLKSRTKNVAVTYGFSAGAEVLASDSKISYDSAGLPNGTMLRVDAGGNSIPVVLEGVFGTNHVYAALAALGATYGLKLNMVKAAESLRNYSYPPGRMCLLQGINGSLLIDDTYNSSPLAAKHGLATLGEVSMPKPGRKIAVLGDMLELGRFTEEAHIEIGGIAAKNADILVLVGPRAVSMKEGAVRAGMNENNIHQFQNSHQAGEFLATLAGQNDLIFLKGSQGMRMERAVEAILKDKENKARLLVRQEKEWLEKE
ncbi:MAG TPA: Mur ligase family protein [Candidatus Paceibacterota bacterium]|nr:Mur ligase family protein [Candidatus Paceibacterota bacterium]